MRNGIYSQGLLSLAVSGVLSGSVCVGMERKGGDILIEHSPTSQHRHQQTRIDAENYYTKEIDHKRNEFLREIEADKEERRKKGVSLVTSEIEYIQKSLNELKNKISDTPVGLQDDIFFPALKAQSTKYEEQIKRLEEYKKTINKETSLKSVRENLDTIRMEYSPVISDVSYPVSLFLR